MVIKKPYAFLIKRFRLIHLILTGLIVYLLAKTYNLFSYFNRYVNNVYSALSDAAPTNYINLYMFLIVILIIAFSLAMYMLMKQKNKPKILYVALSIFYIVYFISLISLFSLFKSMEVASIDIKRAMLLKDSMVILMIPQIIFLVLSIIRGLGFDIKKFNFSKDLEELDISDKDSEEFEFVLGLDTYKYFRAFRKKLREFKYYYLENKFLITGFLGVLIAILVTALVLNFRVYNKVYKVGQKFNVNGLTVQVNDSYLTNLDYKNQVIDKNKYFLIVNATFTNNSGTSTVLDMTNYKIIHKKKRIVPTMSRNAYFIDLGRGYSKEKIGKETTKTYILVYELNKNQVKNKYMFSIYDGASYGTGAINTKNKNVLLIPTRHSGTKVIGKYNLNEKVDLKKSLLKNTTLVVSDYEIKNKFTYKYEACMRNNCESITDVVTADATNGKTLIQLNAKLNLDNTSTFALNTSKKQTFYDTFVTIGYDNKISGVRDVTPGSSIEDTILEVDEEIINAESLNLLVTARGKQYIIKLK